MSVSKKKMTFSEAHALDRKNGEFYVALDEDENMWCVFGSESGWCYSTYLDKGNAEKDCNTMNKISKIG